MIPDIGIYTNVPCEEYFAWEAMNRSTLEHAARSVLHLHTAMNTPSKSTPAMDLGTALHCAVLEPDAYSRRYVVAPKVDRRTTEGKATWESFVASLEGKSIVDADDDAAVRAMADSIRSHPQAATLLDVPGDSEVCVVWDDAETGIRCKARIDRYAAGTIGVDIKTTANASPSAFAKSVFDYGYHRQVAWYADGFFAVTGKATPFVIVAVENSAPWAVCVYRLEDEAVGFGRDDNRRWLRMYADAVRTQRFDGYSDGVVALGLPAWAHNRYVKGEI